ncbi:GspH/FimT family pseudopilin [Marinobacter sp. 1Y8]
MISSGRQTGFTLIELLVTVVILAIVATVALPNFAQVIRNNQATTEANNLLAGLQLARSEAVRLGQNVSMSAVSGSFANGWCVHTSNTCTDGTGGTDDTRVRMFDAPSAVINAGAAQIQFSSRGERVLPTGGNTIMGVQPDDCAIGEVDARRIVTISVNGRAQVTRGNCL